ncbi:HAMP domain-containing sensor histidine kinase, partial [Methanocalculus sp. MSAO_Arc1]
FDPHCSMPLPEWKMAFKEAYEALSAVVDSVCLLSCGCSSPVPEIGYSAHLRSPDVFLTRSELRSLSVPGAYMISSGYAGRHCSSIPFQISPQQEEATRPDTGIRRLIHLRTRDDGNADAGASELAAHLSVPLETLPVDADLFQARLRETLGSLETDALRKKGIEQLRNCEEQVADYTMAFDLLKEIAAAATEKEVVRQIDSLFRLLFSPDTLDHMETPFEEGTSGLILPVAYGHEVLLWYRLDHFAHPEFLDRYRNTAEVLLPVLGLAIRNARVYQRLLDANVEKDKEIAARKEAQEALSLANKKLNILTAITRHDILNDVMVAAGYLYLASDIPVPEEVKSYFQKMEEQITAIQRKVEFTRDYQDMGAQRPNWQDIGAYVDSIAPNILKGSTLSLQNELEGLEIYADPMLGKVVHNLCQNAVFHAASATYLRFFAEVDGDDCVIIVSDNGPGVVDAKKKSIFKPAFGRSHGFGLYLVSEILSITKITITENGTAGAGAAFHIRVPPGAWRRVGSSPDS